MGADPQQTPEAFREAEAYDGTSLIIAYSHCIAHGIELRNGLDQQHRAVASGYWPLVRYDPIARAAGDNPFLLDSPRPRIKLTDYTYRELRYRSLVNTDPVEAERLLQTWRSSPSINGGRSTRKWRPVAPIVSRPIPVEPASVRCRVGWCGCWCWEVRRRRRVASLCRPGRPAGQSPPRGDVPWSLQRRGAAGRTWTPIPGRCPRRAGLPTPLPGQQTGSSAVVAGRGSVQRRTTMSATEQAPAPTPKCGQKSNHHYVSRSRSQDAHRAGHDLADGEDLSGRQFCAGYDISVAGVPLLLSCTAGRRERGPRPMAPTGRRPT